MPGAERPLLGNISMYDEYSLALSKSDEPLPSVYMWAVWRHIGENGYSSKDHKVILKNLLGYPVLTICDADMAHEVFVMKNKFVDKTGHFQQMFEDLASGAFSFEKGDNSWRIKRKAYSHAFFNFSVEKMTDVL